MADLATFQGQANAIFDPQAAAEKASLTSGYNAEKNQLGLYKNETNQSYERALRGVDESEKSQVSSLNQLYSSRLSGQFSGLQGNALQGLYGKDNQARADLATSRANKLAEISGKEVAALDKYNTDERNVDAKITGEKAKYAYSGYDSAVKEEQRVAQEQAKMAEQERFHQDQMNMEYAKMANANANAAASRASRGSSSGSRADSKQADMATIAQTLQGKAGKDGHVSQETWNAAMAAWTGAGYSANEFSKNNIQFVNQRYKGYHGYS